MTDPKSPDETFTWTEDPADAGSDPGRAEPKDESTAPGGSASGATDGGGTVLESLRDAIDDLASMAGPAVRDLSVRAADLVAVAADRAAPIVKRVGDATAEASTKAADRSRTWASSHRASTASDADAASPVADPAAPDTAPEPRGRRPASGLIGALL